MAAPTTNVNKSGTAQSAYELLIGGTYKLVIGGSYTLNIQSASTGTVVSGVSKS